MSSLSTRAALAVQSSLGSAASAGFVGGIFTRSRAVPMYDYAEPPGGEHGISQRASSRKSAADRTSVLYDIALEGMVYPDILGMLLIGVGFQDTVIDNTTYKTHSLTKTDLTAAKYLTMLHKLAESGGFWERKIRDVRLTQLQITADSDGIRHTTTGRGLWEMAAVGTETVTSDTAIRFVTTKGSLVFGSLALGNPQSHQITFSRPVDEEDQRQHEFGRVDLVETGFDLSGVLTGLTMSFDKYKKLVWGGTSGTEPDEVTCTDSLVIEYQSAANINGAAVPYRFNINIPKAEFRLQDFEAVGTNVVRGNVQWFMIDDAATPPVTITLDNLKAQYYS